MPIFNFCCTECNHKFEELVNLNEIPPCPKCHSNQVEKRVSAFYTISEDTRFETHATDLPSMAEWRKKRV